MIRVEYLNTTTWQFKNLAKKHGLSGVEHPFWEGLPLDIVRVLSLDLLHGGYKSFQDHQVPMISELIGASELDDHLIAQPARTGLRTFSQGISKLSQFSGKETRDLMRMIVPATVSAEGFDRVAAKAIAAKIQFLYLAHFPVHSDATLRAMEAKLNSYEDSKWIFVAKGVRRGAKKGSTIPHWRIPKEHNQRHFAENTRDQGPLVGMATEAIEHCHIEDAKVPWRLSNRKNFFPQLRDYIARWDALNLFETYLEYTDLPPCHQTP